MKGILSAALLHKNECVRKKLELDAAVSAAGTAEVVNSVVWSMDI
jgi:hypothetical protein